MRKSGMTSASLKGALFHVILLFFSLTVEHSGVPLTLDIGVIDIETCEPLPNVFVELWMGDYLLLLLLFTHHNSTF